MEPIPCPRPLPIIGNLWNIDINNRLKSFQDLSKTYGPIYKLYLNGADRVFINNHALLDEVCDETRFVKQVTGGINQLRDVVHDGLATARYGSHPWGVARRILAPAFGPAAVRGMYDEMFDIASQQILKWARYGPSASINVTEDFIRLTLDTIGLCALDMRFNSFYRDDLHPFVDAFLRLMDEAGGRSNRPSIQTKFMYAANAQFEKDKQYVMGITEHVIKDRRDQKTEKLDLLNAMLNGRDPKTGEGLDDGAIADNLVTFLVAGHETTAAMLSFLMWYLIKSPESYKKVQDEVDAAIGNGPMTVEFLSKLPYINACLRETLRLQPTGPAFSLRPKPGLEERPITIGGGKYEIQPNGTIVCLLGNVHRDEAVFGEDAENFRPERMLDEEFKRLPKNAWKPFGNGMRGCIGRAFAWQESLLIVALLFKFFDFELAQKDYELSVTQSLAIKPDNLFIRAKLREGYTTTQLERQLFGGTKPRHAAAEPSHNTHKPSSAANMFVYYGSNTGTCEALARKLATDAYSHGRTCHIATLDDAKNNVSIEHPNVFITPSFEGQPPDNGKEFIDWLSTLEGTPLKGIKYAVFGCGHRDWAATFQRIPTITDHLLEKRGGTRLVARGITDAATGEMFEDFERWTATVFWPGMQTAVPNQGAPRENVPWLNIQRSSVLGLSAMEKQFSEAKVISQTRLTSEAFPAKHHLHIKLPENTAYTAGDYLEVVPMNPRPLIDRVLQRFQLTWDSMITISTATETPLPTSRPMMALELFGCYLELDQPATSKDVGSISRHVTLDSEKEVLEQAKRHIAPSSEVNSSPSILDLLEMVPSATIPLGEFLMMHGAIRPRRYSISSSPRQNPSECTLTLSLINKIKPHTKTVSNGLASGYLSSLQAGDSIFVRVKPCHQSFRLPADLGSTPTVFVCSGSGLAPFRGFIEQRAHAMKAGQQVARALIFIGCRSPEGDAIYLEELSNWQKLGAVEVHYAFSQKPLLSDTCRYVQDQLLRHSKELEELYDQGAKMYVCGLPKMGEGVKQALSTIYREAKARRTGSKGVSDADFEAWFTGKRHERYAVDLFL